jgi:argininosuccinate synthase
VRLKLYKGNVIVAGRTSPYSLYREDIATFGDSGETYTHGQATGFINIFGLPVQVRGQMRRDTGLDK